MVNADKLVNLIKKIALEVFVSSKPVNINFGTVKSVAPIIEINIEQKVILTSNQLVITEKTIDIDNPLEIGDTVALIREQGGQRYLVLDKVVQL